MRELRFKIAANPAALHAELAAIPELQPALNEETGALETPFTIESHPRSVLVRVPDDVSESKITAVVEAHDPTSPRERAVEAIGKAETLDELKAALVALLGADTSEHESRISDRVSGERV